MSVVLSIVVSLVEFRAVLHLGVYQISSRLAELTLLHLLLRIMPLQSEALIILLI
jgi:hypothetical protein